MVDDFVLVLELFEPGLASEEASGGHGHHELQVVDDDLLDIVHVHCTVHQLKHLGITSRQAVQRQQYIHTYIQY